MRYKCVSCGSEWDYPFDACIFCSNSLTAIDDGEYVVEGITQVFTPSEDHPITPYFVALLRSSDGSRRFLKTFHKYNIGDNVITSAENGMGCTIGVIGTGVTGKGLVELAIMTGNRVILKSRTQESLDAAIKFISKKLSIKMDRRLAGKNLKYHFKVLSKAEDDEEKVKAVLEMDYGTAENFQIQVKDKSVCMVLPDVCKYDQKWLLAKYRIVADLREALNAEKVRFVEEYIKPAEAPKEEPSPEEIAPEEIPQEE